jgi:hypothetical protein
VPRGDHDDFSAAALSPDAELDRAADPPRHGAAFARLEAFLDRAEAFAAAGLDAE